MFKNRNWWRIWAVLFGMYLVIAAYAHTDAWNLIKFAGLMWGFYGAGRLAKERDIELGKPIIGD